MKKILYFVLPLVLLAAACGGGGVSAGGGTDNPDGTDGNSESGFSEITEEIQAPGDFLGCLLYTSPSPRDRQKSRMPSSA